ncbi:hypothetical protein CMO89_00970 [Candidatus Woesearchaeota archaeon]|nr:hypothetical protein [Candidatus Woesearchaeota archaeon]|tara:strand:+ start:3368 stop:4153 length:786 start_codon:yes stop_codon:yes gene_type:complete
MTNDESIDNSIDEEAVGINKLIEESKVPFDQIPNHFLTGEDSTIRFLFESMPYFGCGQLAELLSKVHLDDKGQPYIPSALRGRDSDIRDLVRKPILQSADSLLHYVFGPSPKVIKKHQRVRDKIRRELTDEIVYAYSVNNLLRYNPLREEGGIKSFERFLNTQVRHHLFEVLEYKRNRESSPRYDSGRRFNRHTKDDLSRNKPTLVGSIQSNGSIGYSAIGERFEELCVAKDITRFIHYQEYRKSMDRKYGTLNRKRVTNF